VTRFICTYKISWLVRAVGSSLLVYYFLTTRSFDFSIGFVLLYFVLGLVIGLLLSSERITKYYPVLNNYYCNRFRSNGGPLQTEDEYFASKINHTLSLAKHKAAWLFLPVEDGLAFVPVLILGINPYTAIISGLIFAFIHINNYSYLECIGKFIIAYLVCILLLPYGLLTVIVGHYINDIIAVLVLKFIAVKHMPNNTLNQTGAKDTPSG
jgi:hypothetical protein